MGAQFLKFHGFGNDYLVVEQDQLAGLSDVGAFAKAVCNRHYGAGADGIAIVSPAEDKGSDFRVRIFNPDGSEAGLSGNGTRCAAAYLYYRKFWSGPELRLITRTGIKRYFARGEPQAGRYLFDSELGQPQFASSAIPMLTQVPLDKVVDYPLTIEHETFRVTALQMGNPNCCIFVDDFSALDWRRIGRALETHPQFPDRTNVTFVRVTAPANIELRIWERGVGETTASGTCSCAAAVAAMVNGLTNRQVNASMPGGEVQIEWRADGEVVLTGWAEVVYAAEWLA
jgi:diaminopimelate epimerase